MPYATDSKNIKPQKNIMQKPGAIAHAQYLTLFFVIDLKIKAKNIPPTPVTAERNNIIINQKNNTNNKPMVKK
jgi:hypothetical protein